jgi:putative ABC transport system permease protein
LSLDRNVLLFAASISMVCALLCGLAPSLNASRTDITANLKDEGRSASPSRSHSRLRTAMVTGEIALALFLLVGTGLLVRAIFVLDHQKLGFETEHLLTASVTLDNAHYKDGSRQTLFVQELISRLQQLPGAGAVAVASDLPATGPSSATFHIKGQPDEPTQQGRSAFDFVVTAAYFRTAGISLLHGREFSEIDNASAPRVVVVNQEFVHRYLQDQEAVGKQIRLVVSGASPEWSEIVGVVGNVKAHSEFTHDDPEVYESFLQRPLSSFSLMLRATSDSHLLASALYSTVAQMDAELPLARVMSMPAVIDSQRAGNPFFERVLGTFAILALILAAVGIYGLIAYSVAQRTHEIGIRMALGARSQDVLRMVLGDGMKMAAIGGAIGLAAALPLPKIFGSMFFDLQIHEPWVYFVVPIAIFGIAILATYVPARRAARVNPMSALRQE